MHCILESTFARIFLFLELPFLQEAQFYHENLSQSSSLEEFPDLPAITVTFCRGHFMWGKHAALFWLGILNSARESSHLQCSKNKKIRAKVDSEGLYGRGRLLFMCSCGRAVSLHLARSGSQSEHRICQILPAHGACHIIIRQYWTGNRAFWLVDFSYWPSDCLDHVITRFTHQNKRNYPSPSAFATSWTNLLS